MKHRPPLWLRVLLAVGIITTCLPASAHAGTPTSQPTTVTQQGRNWGHSVKPATGQPVRRPTVPGSMHEVLAFQTSCRTLLYSDGRQAARVCLDWDDSTSTTWVAHNRRVTNIPGPPGPGHTEDMSGDDGINIVTWHPNTFFCGDGTLVDGATCNDPRNTFQNDANTQWVQVQVDAPWEPGGLYCKRVFFNNVGANSYNNACA